MKKRYCSIMAVMAVAALSAVTVSGCGKSKKKPYAACATTPKTECSKPIWDNPGGNRDQPSKR